MIICSCNAITDHHVRACLTGADCPRTPADVYRALGHRPACGRCAITIRALVAAAGVDANPCGECVLHDLCDTDPTVTGARPAPAVQIDVRFALAAE
jgi:bacterioferritin-associated ferredoxin